MRSRSVFIFWCFVLLSCTPAAFAQKRVFATVDPNATVFNSDATIYDPQTGTLTPAAGVMNVAREQHNAVRLLGGQVLIVGGYNGHYRRDAEIYNPSDGSFTATDDLGVARSGAAAVLLRNGTVLVAGGYNGSYLAIAELYDPISGLFDYASPMNYARQNPTAVLLDSGQVLVTGGFDGTSGAETFQSSSELYDPSLKAFAVTGYMTDARWGHTATLLSDGKVLVTGGCTNSVTGTVVCDKFLASAEIYDPSTGSFTETGAMNTPRANHTATRLQDGRVLIAGGNDGDSSLTSAEIYDPATGTFSITGDLGTARSGHTASILSSGKVLIAGGFSDNQLASAEVFDPAAGTFTALSSSMAVPRLYHSATVLNDGKVLLAGGQNATPLTFDVNFQTTSDNIAPNIVFSPDSEVGFVSYTGSGVVLAFSAETGAVIERIATGGKPSVITPLKDGQRLAVVSALDDKIFIIDMASRTLQSTYTFDGAFGFGSIVSLSPDGNYGYVSSTSTGDVIKFDISTGNEAGRLSGLLAPAQITVTKDGSTLMVVDTGNNEVVFADSSSMTVKYKMSPENSYPGVSFSIFNKVVLNLDETRGAIASQDYGASALTYGTLLVFDPATAEITAAPRIGISPGLTMLLPSGTEWLVLCADALSFVPVDDPDNVTNVTTVDVNTTPGFANMVLSADSQYAYFTTADTDKIYQHDIDTHAVVGAFLVGDDPDVSLDQPMTLAFTPDGKTMVSLNFASNQLNLLDDTTILKQTKFLSQQDKFTGLSIINLADTENAVIVSAIATSGVLYTPDNSVNPVILWLEPNSQSTLDISALFNFDNSLMNIGHLIIESLQPVVAAYSSLGQISPNFLTPYLSSMQAMPFYPDYRKSLYDWIIPEIPTGSDASAEFDFVNPNYNPSPYAVTHYGTDGTVLETSPADSIAGSNLITRTISDFVTTTQVGGVLIFGGQDPPNTSSTADIYSPVTKGFGQALGASPTPRYGHTAVLLQTGKIFIAGGKNGSKILKSAQLYDPAEETFSYTPGTMISERYRHTATLLPDGRVLLAGGQNSDSINNTAELFDPLTGSFTSTAGPMISYRDAHTATLLPDGKVLLTGGLDGMAVTATAEIYDPATSKFYATGSMNAARAFHTAVLLGDGNVLIAGGYNGSYLDSTEIYNPSTGVFTPAASMSTARSQHTATLLSDGTVLIAGGMNSTGVLDSAELYDPETGSFLGTNTPMRAARRSHTATLLDDDPDGNNDTVLIAGGFGYEFDSTTDTSAEIEYTTLGTGEIYTPQGRDFSRASLPMSENRVEATATLMQGSRQGYLRGTSDKGLLVTEIYNNGAKDTSLNAIDADEFSGITRIYSPLFVFSSPYISLVNVINANQESGAIVTLTLHAADGATIGAPMTTILRPNAQLKGNLWQIFDYDPALQNERGWLEVSSSVDRIVGTITLTDAADDFLVTFQLSGIPMKRFVYPLVSEDSTFGTGIALLNSGDQPAHVQLELWSVEGTLDESQSITLNPGTQISMLTNQLFPGMQPRRSGNVRVYSDEPLHGLGTMFDWSLHFILSVPPVAIPEP